MSLDDQVKKILISSLSIGEEEFHKNLACGDIEQWDSLNQLKLITMLEDEFGIMFNDEELAELSSFNKIKEIILNKNSG